GDTSNVENKVVHVSRLTPYYRRVHGGSSSAPEAEQGHPDVYVEDKAEHKDEDGDEKEWPIRQLMGRRSRRGQLEYLVEWEGPYAATWEPAEALPTDLRKVYDEYLGQPRS